MVRVWRRGCNQGDGGRGGGSGGRAGGKLQQQVTLGAVNVQGLGAVFTAAGLLSSPHQVFKASTSSRDVSLGRTRGNRLGEDAWGEFNRAWDDRVATLQWMPEGEFRG